MYMYVYYGIHTYTYVHACGVLASFEIFNKSSLGSVLTLFSPNVDQRHFEAGRWWGGPLSRGWGQREKELKK